VDRAAATTTVGPDFPPFSFGLVSGQAKAGRQQGHLDLVDLCRPISNEDVEAIKQVGRSIG
jgi:hypothetical protein